MRYRHLCFAFALFGSTAFATSTAQAVGKLEASAGPKALVGGALLGSEVVLGTEALLKVKPWWLYVLGGVAGAAGGGVGGYFVDKADSPRTSTLMLAGGMALFIPATVLVIDATAYRQPADYIQDEAPLAEPVADPPRPESAPLATPPEPASTPSAATSRQRQRTARQQRSARYERGAGQAKPALLAYGAGQLMLGVPALELHDVFSQTELWQFGIAQRTELRMSVARWTF